MIKSKPLSLMKKKPIINEENYRTFWQYIRERYLIYLRKEAKQNKPYSDDKILQEWKFTNVFRQLDTGIQSQCFLSDYFKICDLL